MSSRAFRAEFPNNDIPVDTKRPGNTCKFPAGAYGKYFTVQEDGKIIIDPKAYPDDIAAFVSGSIKSNPTISAEIKNHLLVFLDAMDDRAVQRHGYSHSPEERDYERKRLSQ